MGAFARGGGKFYFRQGEICSRIWEFRRKFERSIKENLAASRKQYPVATSLLFFYEFPRLYLLSVASEQSPKINARRQFLQRKGVRRTPAQRNVPNRLPQGIVQQYPLGRCSGCFPLEGHVV